MPFQKKAATYRTVACPMCREELGTFDSNYIYFSTCKECDIKWAWRPQEEKPVALSFPGQRIPERCECANCKDRDARKGH